MARGDDVSIKAYVNGALVASLGGITGAEWDPGLQQDVEDYLDTDAAVVEGFNGTTSLAVTFHPKSASPMQLLELQQRKNDLIDGDGVIDVEAAAVRLSVQFTVRFPDGKPYRISIADATITTSPLSFGGRTAKVATTFTFTGGRWKRMPSFT